MAIRYHQEKPWYSLIALDGGEQSVESSRTWGVEYTAVQKRWFQKGKETGNPRTRAAVSREYMISFSNYGRVKPRHLPLLSPNDAAAREYPIASTLLARTQPPMHKIKSDFHSGRACLHEWSSAAYQGDLHHLDPEIPTAPPALKLLNPTMVTMVHYRDAHACRANWVLSANHFDHELEPLGYNEPPASLEFYYSNHFLIAMALWKTPRVPIVHCLCYTWSSRDCTTPFRWQGAYAYRSVDRL